MTCSVNGSRENKFLSCWLALLEPAPAAAGSTGVTYCRLWRVGATMRNRRSAARGTRPEGHGGGSGPTPPRSPRMGWVLINTPLRQRAGMPSSNAGQPVWEGLERALRDLASCLVLLHCTAQPCLPPLEPIRVIAHALPGGHCRLATCKSQSWLSTRPFLGRA